MSVKHDPQPLSYEDYVLIPDDGLRHEIIDGRHFVTPSPNIPHQSAVAHLLHQLMTQIEDRGRGRVLPAPMDVKLTQFDVLQPDVLVVSTENEGRLVGPYIDGPPDLVIEVLSPSTASRDRGLKRSAYERCGVLEYWILDIEGRSARRFSRTEDGRLLEDGEFTRELPSRVFDNVVLRLDQLWGR